MPFPSPEDLPDPGIELASPALAGVFFTAEAAGKPKSTGVGSLFLLPWIFLTQESNQDLLPLQADSLPTELSGKTNKEDKWMANKQRKRYSK